MFDIPIITHCKCFHCKYFIASILPYHMKRWSFMGSLAQAKGLYKKR